MLKHKYDHAGVIFEVLNEAYSTQNLFKLWLPARFAAGFGRLAEGIPT